MLIKKSELYGSLWKSCDMLRGLQRPNQYGKVILPPACIGIAKPLPRV